MTHHDSFQEEEHSTCWNHSECNSGLLACAGFKIGLPATWSSQVTAGVHYTHSVCLWILLTYPPGSLPTCLYLLACLPAWFSHEYDVCTMICCGYPVWRRSSFLNTNNIYIYTYRYPVQSLVVMSWHALHSLLLDSADISSSGSVCRQWYRTFRSQIATRWHLKAGLLGVECLPWWEPWFNMVQELNFCRCVRPWSICECTSNHWNVKRWTSSSGCSHRRLHPLIRFWAPTYRGQKVWKWPCFFCLARQLTLDTQPRVASSCMRICTCMIIWSYMIYAWLCISFWCKHPHRFIVSGCRTLLSDLPSDCRRAQLLVAQRPLQRHEVIEDREALIQQNYQSLIQDTRRAGLKIEWVITPIPPVYHHKNHFQTNPRKSMSISRA